MHNSLISLDVPPASQGVEAFEQPPVPPWRLLVKAVMAAGFAVGLLAANPTFAQASPHQNWTPMAAEPPVDFLGAPASRDARLVAEWVVKTGDNHSLPFVIVDKKAAEVFVFNGQARLTGATPALLGSARGDDSAAGVGERKLSDIRPQERTTPAGRFVASLGYGLGKQDILWVDYKAALALHRVLAAGAREHRLQQRASSPQDHRVTFGCINVPAAFYDDIVQPAFRASSGVVYILPEVKSISQVFFAASS